MLATYIDHNRPSNLKTKIIDDERKLENREPYHNDEPTNINCTRIRREKKHHARILI